ncbi:MAG: hypothetical protein Q4D74_02550, partial [Comamonadaceae bacterium]|nr:hypothetical protein [Comamonadaceae bacterium]
MKVRFSIAATATAALACLSAPAMAASHTVAYACDGGQQVNVRYKFNSAGIPTSAQATLGGRKQVMAYDLNRSDDVGTFFKNKAGYRLSGDQMDASNYRKASIMITSPKDEILFKSCAPKSGAAASQHGHASAASSVSYSCQNGQRFQVAYRFNSAGIPVSATANLNGKRRTLSYDQNNSTDVETFFTGQGYRLGTDAMTNENFRTLGVMVTAPNGNLLHKG